MVKADGLPLLFGCTKNTIFSAGPDLPCLDFLRTVPSPSANDDLSFTSCTPQVKLWYES
jgi:hypothetical protein